MRKGLKTQEHKYISKLHIFAVPTTQGTFMGYLCGYLIAILVINGYLYSRVYVRLLHPAVVAHAVAARALGGLSQRCQLCLVTSFP